MKTLSKVGFKIVYQKRSHIYLTDGRHKITVPRHEIVKRGTLLSIIQQAGLTRNEFLRLLKER